MILKIPPPIEPDPPTAIPVTEKTTRFCPTSLTDWVELCRRAGVPHIPAERISTVMRLDWMTFDQEDAKDRLDAVVREVEENLKPNHMFRFDFCAPLELKYQVSEGNHQLTEQMTWVIFDDPRAFDLLFSHPREEIPVHQRPWINATTKDGYPVEYRVFVRDGKILGISNYYPQRPMEMDNRHMHAVMDQTELLIAHVQTPFLWNKWPGRKRFFKNHPKDGVHFTADFMVNEDGEVLFIEGGPPHELGAHPCCFQPGKIEGIALSDRNGGTQG